MIIKESFTIDAPPDRVAAFLIDIDRMSRCVPGVGDVHAVGDNEFEAVLSLRLGPIHARFAGSVIIDASEAPTTLRAVGKGRDGATGSQAQVEFLAQITQASDGGTLVDSTSDVTIRGKLGQFGTGVIASTARALIGEFVRCAAGAIGSDPTDTEGAGSPPGIGRVVGKGIATYLMGLLGSVRRFWRRIMDGGRRS